MLSRGSAYTCKTPKVKRALVNPRQVSLGLPCRASVILYCLSIRHTFVLLLELLLLLASCTLYTNDDVGTFEFRATHV